MVAVFKTNHACKACKQYLYRPLGEIHENFICINENCKKSNSKPLKKPNMKTPKLIKSLLKKWCLKNFPLEITTQKRFLIFVKKGKIREWRAYNEDHNRINLTKKNH